MSVSQNKQQNDSSEKLVKVLGGLTFVFIALMVVCFITVYYFSLQDKQYVGHTASMKVLSQQIAKNATEAANGKTDSYPQLREYRNLFDAHYTILRDGLDSYAQIPAALKADMTAKGEVAELNWVQKLFGLFGSRLLPSTSEADPEEALRAINKVRWSWQAMNGWTETDYLPDGSTQEKEQVGLIREILDRQETVIRVNILADRFRANVPTMQRNAEEMVDRLVEIEDDRRKISAAANINYYLEQVSRNLNEMLAGGIGNQSAQGRVQRSLADLEETLKALSEGNSRRGINSVRDARARQRLTEITGTFTQLKGEIDEILKQTPELFKVHDSAHRIFTVSEHILAGTNWLEDRYGELKDKRLVKEWWGFAFGLLALLALFVRGVISRTNAKRRIEETERLKRLADEEAEKNQLAILDLLDEMQGLSEGDLTVTASVGEAFTGAIADSFNSAIEALRQLVTTINETSVQVSSSAQETQATAMHLAEASDHQAHQITAASAAINEMAVSIDQVSKNAQESANVAQKSVDLALKGASTVRKTITGMDSIREQIQETSKRIKRLGESSQEIGNIVELINDIADQTNILALNASIQAAMAGGDAGRGFAVVADEVQRLAERSSNATKQIEALVKTIQTDTNEAVISMEQSTAGVVAGAKLAEDAGEALREIESVSTQLANLIQNISEAARQQANAAANISDTMNVIQEITSQTSAGTNETATSIGNLADLANELRNSVAGFKLPE
jgi:twitching motility protein PilJ